MDCENNPRCPCNRQHPRYDEDFFVKMMEAIDDGVWKYVREGCGLECKLCGHNGGMPGIAFTGWSPEMVF